MVNFGQDEAGFGTIEPRASEKPKEPSEELELPVIPKKETVITQDYEDAPSINANNEKPDPNKPVNQQSVSATTPQTTQTAEQPHVDSRAIWGKNRNTSSTASEGVVPGGTGNQGSPGGDINSQNHSLGGGFGNGIVPTLEGRESVSLPQPPKMKKEGAVVVEITVNQTGKVINAVPGVKGSTTLDAQLLEAAKNAALASRFSRKDDAPEFQKGKIVYYFRYQ